MKRGIALFLAIIMLASSPMELLASEISDVESQNTSVKSGVCGDNLTWTLDAAGCLTISGTGDMWDLHQNDIYQPTDEVLSPWYDYENQITAIVFEDGVEKVDIEAFSINFVNLKSVYIGKDVSLFDDFFGEFFWRCDSIETYTVSEHNTSFMSHEGVLYSKDGTILYDYPGSKKETSYTVLATTKELYLGAVNHVAILEELILPEGLTRINMCNINDMTQLKELTIPSTVVEILSDSWEPFIGASSRLEKITNNSSAEVGLDFSQHDYWYWGDEDAEKLEVLPAKTIAYRHAGLVRIYGASDIEVEVGKTAQYYYEAEYHTIEGCNFKKEPVTYTSSDESILTIDSNGVMTGHKEGTVTVTVAPKYLMCNEIYAREVQVKEPQNLNQIIVNNMFFKLNGDGTASLTNGRYYKDKVCRIPSYIPHNNVLYPVVEIGKMAFSGNTYIESVIIENVSGRQYRISAQAFEDCVNLKDISLPQNLKTIDAWAFLNCKGLKSITLPDTVSYIASWAFQDAVNLEKIEVAYTDESWKIDELNEKNRFCEDAIWGCSKLKVLQIPSEILRFEPSSESFAALEDGSIELTCMPNTRDIVMPQYHFNFFEKIKEIHAYGGTMMDGYAAYFGVPFVSLGDIEEYLYSYEDLGNNQIRLVSYNSYFGNNGSRDSVTIPSKIDGKTVVETGGIAYSEYEVLGTFQSSYSYNISSFKKIILPDTITTIHPYTFYNVLVEEVVIPDGVKTIKENAFCGVSLLESITVPNTVTMVEEYAFMYVGDLKEFRFTENCPVYDNCIDQSWKLEKLYLPEHVLIIRIGNLDSDMVTIYGYSNTPVEYYTEDLNWEFETIGQGNFPFQFNDYLYDETGDFYIGGYKGDDAKIVVPSTYGPYKITGVSHLKTFSTDKEYIVELEEGITTYDLNALYKTSYKELYLPKSITTIVGHASQGWPGYEGDSWTVNVYAYPSECVENWIEEANDYFKNNVYENIKYVFKNRDTSQNEVKVTFNVNGGKSLGNSGTRTLDKGQKVGTLPKPTRTGYTFVEWNTKKDGTGSKVTSSTKVSSDKVYYAKWKVNKYDLKFNANGGSGKMDTFEDVKYTTKVTLTNKFTRKGYKFLGWAKSKDGDIVYKDGQTVNGISSKNGEVTLYAKWKKNEYKITYNVNSGNLPDNAVKKYTVTTTTFNLPKPTRTGYTFGGWYTDKDCKKTKVTKIERGTTGNKTYYAKWTVNKYKITFNANGGTGTMSPMKDVTYTKTVTLTNKFKRTGYTFTGWATSKDGSVKHKDKATVSKLTSKNGGEVNLYAKWTVNKYNIKYNANGGTGTMSTKKDVKYTDNVKLAANKFTRKGYSFAGWATSKDGSVKYKDKASVSKLTSKNGSNVTLYAKWTVNKYNIKYNANGGTGTMSTKNDVKYTDKVTLSANKFKKSGYTFQGWATSKSGKVVYKNKASVSKLTSTNGKTVTLYAVWKKK